MVGETRLLGDSYEVQMSEGRVSNMLVAYA
jgi:hypothetical protein